MWNISSNITVSHNDRCLINGNLCRFLGVFRLYSMGNKPGYKIGGENLTKQHPALEYWASTQTEKVFKEIFLRPWFDHFLRQKKKFVKLRIMMISHQYNIADDDDEGEEDEDDDEEDDDDDNVY